MTMKDKLASYNHLIETFVIVTETFLCGLLFLLFSKLSNEMQWDSLQVGGTTVLQVMLTLMLCYALCAIHSGVVLHRRKVHSLQIWKRVFENMFLFVLLGGLVLSVGKYADIASLFMLETFAASSFVTTITRSLAPVLSVISFRRLSEAMQAGFEEWKNSM